MEYYQRTLPGRPPDQIYVSNLNLEISGGLGATMTGRVISLTDKLPHRESLPYIQLLTSIYAHSRYLQKFCIDVLALLCAKSVGVKRKQCALCANEYGNNSELWALGRYHIVQMYRREVKYCPYHKPRLHMDKSQTRVG